MKGLFVLPLATVLAVALFVAGAAALVLDFAIRTVLTDPTELARKKGNPRHSYPVEIDGVVYPDAEEAFQRVKPTWLFGMAEREAVCTRVIEAKLRQHLQLVEFITATAACSGWPGAGTSPGRAPRPSRSGKVWVWRARSSAA